MIAYRDEGKGKPLILLHAYPLSSRMWEAEIQWLSEKARVIAPDLPGFGKSTQIPITSIAAMAEEVAALLDHLKISKPVFLAGISMGGYVAFEFLRQFPKRVGGLGLFDTRATADTPEAREKRMQAIEMIEKHGLEAYARKAVKTLLGQTTQETNPSFVQQIIGMMMENTAQAAAGAMRALAGRRDNSNLLSSVSVPVILAVGEEDVLTPSAEMRAMHEQIRGSEFHIIAKSGHLTNLEKPAELRNVFEKFLREKFL